MDELDASERSFKKAKQMSDIEKRKKEEKEAALKEQGRKMREEREGRAAASQREAREMELDTLADKPETVSFDPQEAPVRVKYTLPKRPDLSTQEALLALLKPFGPIDESCLIFTLKQPKDKPNAPPKFATAIVVFKKVEDAFGVVGASGQESRGMKNIEISWAKGEEPSVIKTLRENGLLGTGKRQESVTGTGSSSVPAVNHPSQSTIPASSSGPNKPNLPFSYDSKSISDFESVTLMRMRQAERDRLAKEIEEAENNESNA